MSEVSRKEIAKARKTMTNRERRKRREERAREPERERERERAWRKRQCSFWALHFGLKGGNFGHFTTKWAPGNGDLSLMFREDPLVHNT